MPSLNLKDTLNKLRSFKVDVWNMQSRNFYNQLTSNRRMQRKSDVVTASPTTFLEYTNPQHFACLLCLTHSFQGHVQIPTLAVLATWEHVHATISKCARLSQVLKMPKSSALNSNSGAVFKAKRIPSCIMFGKYINFLLRSLLYNICNCFFIT